MPAELQLPSNPDFLAIGDEANLIKTFFMVRRWLGNPATDLKVLDKDTSLPALWKQDLVMELPKDRKYQNCLLRVRSRQSATVLNLKETEHMPENQIILQLVLMGDPVWLCLFKADFSDKSTVRGNLRVKFRI